MASPDDDNDSPANATSSRFSINPAMKQALSLPQSLCNDYALRSKVSTVNGHLPPNKPPLAQYSNAQGFSYAWGQLLERRMDNQVLWDFCLEALLDR